MSTEEKAPAVCQNDPNPTEYLLINGDEKEFICSVCLKDSLFDLVTNNDTTEFTLDKWKTIEAERGVKAIITCV
jgi:hypothetical protein